MICSSASRKTVGCVPFQRTIWRLLKFCVEFRAGPLAHAGDLTLGGAWGARLGAYRFGFAGGVSDGANRAAAMLSCVSPPPTAQRRVLSGPVSPDPHAPSLVSRHRNRSDTRLSPPPRLLSCGVR